MQKKEERKGEGEGCCIYIQRVKGAPREKGWDAFGDFSQTRIVCAFLSFRLANLKDYFFKSRHTFKNHTNLWAILSTQVGSGNSLFLSPVLFYPLGAMWW